MSFFGRVVDRLRGRPWYELPLLLAVPRLIDIRNTLRQKNLHDTEEEPLTGGLPPPNAEQRAYRSFDGTYNDLQSPRMGCAGSRLGRNFPLEFTFPDPANLLNPSPRDVSIELMTRHQFQPATILNLLAASWIQFQTHDWFSHGRYDEDPQPIEVPLQDSDDWPHRPMRVPHTRPDPNKPGSSRPPAFRNLETQWWDASQIYGSSAAINARLRTGKEGKLKIQDDGKLPLDPESGIDLTGFIDNWWIGLSMLHALFTAEHNAICDRLRRDHPEWDDNRLFQQGRLVNAALLAKIHTIEWTPAILPQRTIVTAMNTNWRGFTRDLQNVFRHLNDNELLGGIVGSPTDHHTAPYSLTEEFVSVYRMHPLMPDALNFLSAHDGKLIDTQLLPELSGRKNRPHLDRHSLPDLFYSFGMAHPGAIRLHNYPRFLQNLVRDNGDRFDMAAVDILRDRERGVPRYNKFRELLHMEPVRSFDELAANKQWAEEIRRVYRNDLSMVDLQVGLFAEPLPDGFGFSETAFRVFVLMASRRLKSDRFLTSDYRQDIYTKTGLDWIEDNSMKSVLLRHYPSLAPALDGIENAFEPWKPVQPGAPAR